MGKTYRTARGQVVDIESLAMQNEKTIASGNMSVNAKGDKVKGGKVVQTAAERVAPYHKARKDTTTGSIRPKVKTKEDAPLETTGTIKEREDGSQYEEIVGEDGSIETREVKSTPKKKTAAQRKKDASI